jgi:hypothetical protein
MVASKSFFNLSWGTATLTRLALLGQGVYYPVTGIWPILDRRSFEQVTGPKVDF